MKRIALLLLLSTTIVRGDDLTRNVQSELKELGFFYAEVSGNVGPETTAAIRRFQIRNGYEVTGTLTPETLKGLKLERAGAAPTAPAPAPAPVKKEVPAHLRRNETVEESDRNFLRQDAARQRSGRDPSVVTPPAPLNPPPDPGRADYSSIFAHTPYESAPADLQAQTVRKAQVLLARGGFYHNAIDGAPGPATEEALLRFQRRQNMVMSGRLDFETLSAMSLLPGRSEGPETRPFTVPKGSRYSPRVLRGIWID